jgi:hypothetical protein
LRSRHLAVSAALSGLVLGGTSVAPAHAAGSLVVTTTADSGAGSLRQALADAAASPEDDTIVFDPTVGGVIVLTSGQLPATVGGDSGNLVIQGPGADVLAIDAGNHGRVMDVQGGAGAPSFGISGLTVTHGVGGGIHAVDAAVRLDDMVVSDNSSGGDGWSPVSGGGVAVLASDAGSASLVIDTSTIEDNTASDTGGGVFASPEVAVTVSHSSVRDNTAWSVARGSEVAIMRGKGGGIAAGDLTVSDTSVDGNSAQLTGGGILARALDLSGSTISGNHTRYQGGGVLVTGTGPEDHLNVGSSTVSDNRAAEGAGLHAANVPVGLTSSTIASNAGVSGGGLFAAGEVTLQGTAMSTNAGGDLAGGGSATLVRSLVQDPGGDSLTADAGSLVGRDAILQPMADNGGTTSTRLPAGNSPLIDQSSVFGVGVDQRGSTRPVDDPGTPNADDGSDIGAVEATTAELAAPDQVANLSRPTITGEARVGRTLTTDGGTWSPDSVTLTYQWLRDGRPIAEATGSSYTLTIEDYDRNWYGEDLQKRISLRVIANAPGELPSTVESTPTSYVRRGIVEMQGHPTLRGKALVGRTLRVRPRLFAVSPAGCSLGIRWYVGHTFVRRAQNDRTLELRPWMRGHRVKVNLSYMAGSGYRTLHRQLRTRHGVR